VSGTDDFSVRSLLHGPAGLVAWSLIPTAIAAIAGYAVLKQTTARG